MARKTDVDIKATESDYSATSRKIVDGKTIQYSAGGSRVDSGEVSAFGSKVGSIKSVEVYGKTPPSISQRQMRDPKLNPYNNGTVSWDKEKHILTDLDEKTIQAERVFKNGKWRPINSKFSIGDMVLITDKEHPRYNMKGVIRNIREYVNYTMAVNISAEDASKVRNGIPNEKVVVKGDQVELYSASDNWAGDYLTTDLGRKDIVAQDTE